MLLRRQSAFSATFVFHVHVTIDVNHNDALELVQMEVGAHRPANVADCLLQKHINHNHYTVYCVGGLDDGCDDVNRVSGHSAQKEKTVEDQSPFVESDVAVGPLKLH